MNNLFNWELNVAYDVDPKDNDYCNIVVKTNGVKSIIGDEYVIGYYSYNDAEERANITETLKRIINEIVYYIIHSNEKYKTGRLHIIDDETNNYHIIHSFWLEDKPNFKYINYCFDDLVVHPITGKTFIFNSENCSWLDMHDLYCSVFPDETNPYK